MANPAPRAGLWRPPRKPEELWPPRLLPSPPRQMPGPQADWEPAVTSVGQMAAAGLSVALKRRCWQWDLRVGVGQPKRRLHGEQEFANVLVWAPASRPPRQERQGGGPQTGQLRPRLSWRRTGAKHPDRLAMVSGTGRVNRGPLPPAPALSSSARRQGLA